MAYNDQNRSQTGQRIPSFKTMIVLYRQTWLFIDWCLLW